MPNAKFEIKRKCECCGATFIAKTLDSHYCSRACSQKAYDKRMAEKKKLEQLNAIVEQIPDARDYISVQEAVAMFGISKDTIYRLIKKGKIPAINIGERLTRINKSKLEEMFPLQEEPIIVESYPVFKTSGGKPSRIKEALNRTITTPIWDKNRNALRQMVW